MFFDWWKPCQPPQLTNWNSMVPFPKRKIYVYSFLYNPRLNWSIQLCKWFHCGCLFPFWNIFVLQSGEMIVGPSKALFMDEISTGLDSSTTFQIVSCLQQLAHIWVYNTSLTSSTSTRDLRAFWWNYLDGWRKNCIPWI